MLLIEGTIHSRLVWADQLTCTTEEFDQLVDKGVFERIRNGTWRLRFVGSLVMISKLWLSIPKVAADGYISGKVDFGRFETILQALELYSVRSKDRIAGHDDLALRFSASNTSTSPLRELEILAALIEWTSSYGFHANEVEFLSSGLNRPVQWAKTFAFDLPLHTRTGVVYGSPVCVNAIRKNSPVTMMQAYVLINLLKKYDPVTRLLIENSAGLIFEATELLEHCQSTPLLSLSQLQDFFDSTNKDHEKDLLSLLLSYVKIDEYRREQQDSIKLYGTTAFELVWEDMCRHVFAPASLECPLLSNPRYELQRNDGSISLSQRPDVLHHVDDTVFIFDAKYYVDFPNSPPGLEDVRKQFFYAMSLPENSISVSGFLFPQSASKNVEYLGHIVMQAPTTSTRKSAEDFRFPRVHCIGIPWTHMLDCYLERTSVGALRVRILAKVKTIKL